MKPKHSGPCIIGYEVLRRLQHWEAPGHSLDPRFDRAVLGAHEKTYMVPPGVDVFELGIIDRPGPHELLPIDEGGKPHWEEVVHVLVSEAVAHRQRELLLRAYRALCSAIQEADALEIDVADWSRAGKNHPVFGMLRLTTIDVWASLRRPSERLGERELDSLYAKVARRVATLIGAHLVD